VPKPGAKRYASRTEPSLREEEVSSTCSSTYTGLVERGYVPSPTQRYSARVEREAPVTDEAFFDPEKPPVLKDGRTIEAANNSNRCAGPWATEELNCFIEESLSG
jgi:hypothetical protein